MLQRPPVEQTCWPESYGNSDWAARRIYEILLFPTWIGQPSEGQVLPCKAMATPRRNDSGTEEWSKSSFSRQDYTIFTSSSHQSV